MSRHSVEVEIPDGRSCWTEGDDGLPKIPLCPFAHSQAGRGEFDSYCSNPDIVFPGNANPTPGRGSRVHMMHERTAVCLAKYGVKK